MRFDVHSGNSFKCYVYITLFIVLMLLLSPVAIAQTGATLPTQDDLDELPVWEPDEMGTSENYLVDLRRRLPPIGTQTMNDCVGWAMGYMVKSYHESIDQKWNPDHPRRQFSPIYIYNQINGGHDRGSDMIEAARLLKEKGCATLATAPYRYGDYLTQPSDLAHKEAARFKIASWGIIRNGQGIRTALAQGYPVVIGVRTNPLFMSGRFDLYTKQMHEDNISRRQANQRHGFHAMVVVGYDDSRQAYLVANSWGKNWGKNGYCWISYEAMESIDYRNSGNTFVFLAMVLVDERNPLNNNTPNVANRDKVDIVGIGNYVGYSSHYKKHLYQFSANLSGAQATMQQIEKVVWRYAFNNETRQVASTQRVTGYRATGMSTSAIIPVQAEVTFKDGAKRVYKSEIKLKSPEESLRELRLIVTDEYYGRMREDGQLKPSWWWTARLEGDLADLRDIDHVIYLTPNMHWSGAEHRVNAVNNPELEFSGLATRAREIVAQIKFRDGTEMTLKTTPRFDARVDDNFSIDVSTRINGEIRGRRNYHFTTTINMPYGWKLQTQRVVWDMGELFGHYKPVGRGMESDFAASGDSTRNFLIKAKVYLKNGQTKDIEKWVSLGTTAKYPDTRKIDISTSDEYFGIENGEATWLTTLWPVGHPVSLQSIQRVTYTLPPQFEPRVWVREKGDGFNFVMKIRQTEPVQVNVKIEYSDGGVSNFTVKSDLYSVRNDRLFLNAQVKKGTWDDPDLWAFQTRIEGPRTALSDIGYVDVRLPQGFYGGFFRINQKNAGPGGSFQFGDTFWGRFTAEAVVHLTDGFTERLTTSISESPKEWLVEGARDVKPRVRERFYGVVNKSPMWAHYISLEGDQTKLDQIVSVEYKLPDFMPDPVRQADANDHFKLRVMTRFSINVDVTATLKDGSKREWSVWLPCYAPRYGDLTLLQRTENMYNNNQEVRRDWLVWLAGPEVLMRDIEQVTFLYERMEKRYQLRVSKRTAAAYGGYHASSYEYNPIFVTAQIRFKDGRQRELKIRTCLDDPKLQMKLEDRYWGKMEGRDVWILKSTLIGNMNERQSIESVSYTVNGQDNWLRSRRNPDYYSERRVYGPFTTIMNRVHFINGQSRDSQTIRHELMDRADDRMRVKTMQRQAVGENNQRLTETVYYVTGPEQKMRKIERVDYHITRNGRSSVIYTLMRHGDVSDGYELPTYDPAITRIHAVIRYTDETTERAELSR